MQQLAREKMRLGSIAGIKKARTSFQKLRLQSGTAKLLDFIKWCMNCTA